jgi:hypothetical protein
MHSAGGKVGNEEEFVKAGGNSTGRSNKAKWDSGEWSGNVGGGRGIHRGKGWKRAGDGLKDKHSGNGSAGGIYVGRAEGMLCCRCSKEKFKQSGEQSSGQSGGIIVAEWQAEQNKAAGKAANRAVDRMACKTTVKMAGTVVDRVAAAAAGVYVPGGTRVTLPGGAEWQQGDGRVMGGAVDKRGMTSGWISSCLALSSELKAPSSRQVDGECEQVDQQVAGQQARH